MAVPSVKRVSVWDRLTAEQCEYILRTGMIPEGADFTAEELSADTNPAWDALTAEQCAYIIATGRLPPGVDEEVLFAEDPPPRRGRK